VAFEGKGRDIAGNQGVVRQVLGEAR